MPQLTPTEHPASDHPLTVDLAHIARDMKLLPESVETTVQLLDEGNTIPFITRFRKDLTGGLNEHQILAIKQSVALQRALCERKTYILKSIESQHGLTDELKAAVRAASSIRRLEDLYLPFKPQKQSRAATAKQQGLEPLAEEIFSATASESDLATRATNFVRVDKGLNSVDEVIRGVTDLLVEKFGENGELRSNLRQILWNTGKLVSQAVAEPAANENQKSETPTTESPTKKTPTDVAPNTEAPVAEAPTDKAPTSESPAIETPTDETPNSEPTQPETVTAQLPVVPSVSIVPSVPSVSLSPADTTSETLTPKQPTAEQPAIAVPKKKKKKKKKKAAVDPFKDYHDFQQPLKNIPNHRVLAINRGERAGGLKVKIQADDEQLSQAAIAALVPADHPFQEFLQKSALEALSKVLLPSLEREIRRELTEAAEKHAVEVFANNLRNLLLRPPIRDRRVLAIDPGFKSGCAVAVLDPFGNLIDSGHVFIVGNSTRRDESKTKLAAWIKQHSIDIVAIGTGAACRQAEQLVSDTISEFLQDHKVRYVMVNEAGASFYSTSEIGREELPDIAPAIRSAISIGRRLQDPLSELVKISPANIGVGMYQHDVRAKHLSESLDEVVQLCVNQVGVNVNTASPSLLKYVSGLNALTARRLIEHRQQINGFKNRQQLKEVSGIGDATFVQAAGFLRIRGGDNPLDATSIHPESYAIAESIIDCVGTTPAELFPFEPDNVAPIVAVCSANEAKTLDDAKQEIVSGEAQVSRSASETNDADVTTGTTELAKVDSVITGDPASEQATQPEGLRPAATSEQAAEKVSQPEGLRPAATTTKEDDDLPYHRKKIIDNLAKQDIEQIAAEKSAGKLLVRDILMALRKPDWDPRDKIQKPIFRRGIIKLDDLKPEMQLDSQIVNVVDFGVFVDIGLGESSLVHISQLSNQYVRDPHRFCAVGDILKVWVSEIDSQRRRVKLTAIQPGSSKSGSRRRSGKPRSNRSDRSESATRKPENQSGATSTDSHSTRPPSSDAHTGQKRFDRNKDDRGKGDRGKPNQSRDSRSGDKGGRFRHQTERPKTTYTARSSKPAPPITDEMLKGQEPMRSFSDLFQFVHKKPDKPEKES